MERLLKKRKVLRSQVTRVINEFNERQTSLTTTEATLLHARLSKLEQQLDTVNTEIEPLVPEDDAENDYEQVFEYQDRIITCLAGLKLQVDSGPLSTQAAVESAGSGIISQTAMPATQTTTPAPQTATSGKTRVKLPKIDLLKFTGRRSDWQPFWEVFEQVVDKNEDLSDIDRFHYLRASVTGDAAAALAGLPLTARCYNDAIQLLKKRFGNEELLVQEHLKRLIDLKPVRSSDDIRGLRRLYDTLAAHIKGLETLGQKLESYSSMLIPIVQRAMPRDILLDFSRKCVVDTDSLACEQSSLTDASSHATNESGQGTVSSLLKLLSFLRVEVESRENLNALQCMDLKQQPREELKGNLRLHGKTHDRHVRSAAMLHQNATPLTCFFCGSNEHKTQSCDAAKTLEEKKQLLRSSGRCFKCTKSGHQSRACRVSIQCNKCRKKHASTMCDPSYTGNRPPEPNRTVTNAQTATALCSGETGKAQVRVLFDGGSQRSYITADTSRKLGCTLLGHERLTVGVFGGHQAEREFRRVKVTLKTNRGDDRELEVLETDTICDQPIPSPPERIMKRLKSLGYEPAEFSNNNGTECVDLLIGSDHIWDLTTGRSVKLENRLRAVETSAGWTVQGPIEDDAEQTHCFQTVTLRTSVIERQTTDILTKFWDLESIGVKEVEENDEICQALEFFEDNIKRVGNRYEVALPWKSEISLEDNREIALKRLNQLANRLKRAPDLLEEYDAVIRQYDILDMAERVEVKADHNHCVYHMPHQAVLRDSRKLRVVFDASSHAKSTRSLNDNLETGPNLTADLVGLLLNFRKYRVALVADIEQAFLQIGVREQDRDALRFFWFRETPQAGTSLPPIETWRMKRVPFGTTASPFLLSATLQHHLKACEEEFPHTASQLQQSLYVDDLLTGADDEEGALKLYNEANAIFHSASMKLHKWSSNNERLRRLFGQDGSENKSLGFLSGVLKVLGLTWDPITDRLTFAPCVASSKTMETDTKRSMLQTTARIYDPLGWLSPFIVRAKILFQQLWRQNVEWDDALPNDIAEGWKTWYCELKHLPEIQVPRYYGADFSGPATKTHLHIFADASPAAYGAVAYLTIASEDGLTSTIVMSKSRVAPLKELTLARLELMACLLATRLCSYIVKTLGKHPDCVTLWTDSAIALHWIRGDTERWQQFVRNRVREIQQSTGCYEWRHCPGKENPADLLTRGVTVSRLATSEIWWTGPKWLCAHESEWPNGLVQATFTDEELESRQPTKALPAMTSQVTTPALMNVSSYSSFTRLIRVTAWVLRFIFKARRRSDEAGPLTPEELDRAELFWIRNEQREGFSKELHSIRNQKAVPNDSPLRNASLVVDENGVLRIDGRLQRSHLSYDSKHPVVIPKGSHLAKLLAHYCHLKVLHGGIRHTLTQLRERYHVIGARQLVKRIVKECITCQRFNVQPANEVTAPLPTDRITEAQPFQVTGVDFAGPLVVKGLSPTKCYVALFTCAVTRAIHLELVADMSAGSFLLAFRRFAARRGLPSTIYSDNALTFKKVNRDLGCLWDVMRGDPVQDHLMNSRVQWKFIVERGPWWGGFYERLVGLTKQALKKTLGTSYLTFEEMSTTLAEVEAVLNSRPLTHVYTEPNEPEPLCPAMFLTGRRLTSLPELQRKEISALSCNHLRQMISTRNKALQGFWRRWCTEYLKELQLTHSKGAQRGKQVKIGDVVLLKEALQPRQMWKLGIIERAFTGRDNRTRAFEVRLPGGTRLRRPIQLLYPLELSD